MKRKLKALTLLSTLTIAAPVAAVVSCGNDNKPKTHAKSNGTTTTNVTTPSNGGGDTTGTGETHAPETSGTQTPAQTGGVQPAGGSPVSEVHEDANPFANSNPFVFSGAGSGGSAENSLGNIEQSTIAEHAFNHSHWGVGRNDDPSRSAGESGPMTARMKEGAPLHGAFTWYDLWNWNPIANADGSLTGEDITKKLDYLDPNYHGEKPALDHIWGLTDKKFLRASVRKPVAREFGEEMMPSQSTLAPYWDTRTYNNVGAPTGMVPGINNGSQWVYQNSFTYQQAHAQWTHSSQWSIWEAMWPSADYIDVAHRHGVPVLGLGWMMTGYTRPEIMSLITQPGPNKDYPIAKGMAEMANYIGFDGWWMDWEGHSGDIPGFVKALNSYAKTDKYTTVDGVEVNLAVENAKAREMYHYGPREQIIANYSGGPNVFGAVGDHYFSYQNHGAGGNNSGFFRTGESTGHDKFWTGSASNADEDGLAPSLAHHWGYYAGTSAWSGGNRPGGDQSLQPNDLNHRMDFAMWFHNWTHDDFDSCDDIYSSYTRDPRVRPKTRDKLSVGNLYRERTPIVGRKSFTTNFNVGNGSHFNLWGSRDLLNYTQGASSRGWKHQGIQDVLPTYKFIIDWYQGNRRLNDPDHPQYTADGRVQRPVNLVYNNNDEKSWFGGSTLSVLGDLPVGQSMEAKLYASRTKLKAGDKVSFKIKNKWKNAGDRIIPKFATWTTDQEVETQQYWPSDGTMQNVPGEGNIRLGWDRSSENAWDRIPQALKYQKAPVDNITEDQKQKTILDSADATVTEINSDWLDVSYTIPESLDGKTMLDFGFAADSKGPNTISQLTIGQLSYQPVDEVPTEVTNITNIKTDDVWKLKNVTKARISWDTLTTGDKIIDSDKIRHYITFFLNDKGERESISWIGSNPAAYLDLIDKSKDVQNIEIVAVDNNYKAIFSKKVAIKLSKDEE